MSLEKHWSGSRLAIVKLCGYETWGARFLVSFRAKGGSVGEADGDKYDILEIWSCQLRLQVEED